MGVAYSCVVCGETIVNPERNYLIRGNYCCRCTNYELNEDVSKKEKYNCGKKISMDGLTKNMASWSRVLGVSRERVRQLYSLGKLEGRVRNALSKKGFTC